MMPVGFQLQYQLEDCLSPHRAWTAYSSCIGSPRIRGHAMARRAAFSLLMAGVLVCGDMAAAQPATPPALPAQSQSAAHITLGQSAVPLYGPWKFTVGDSPNDPKTRKPLW